MKAKSGTTGPSGHRARAFSLAELLVVLAVMGVLAGSVVVALQGRTRSHGLRVAAEDLASALRYAAAQARQTGAPHRVTFLNEGRAYRVEALDQTGKFERVPGLAGRSRALPKGVTLQRAKQPGDGAGEALTEITLYGDGSGFEGKLIVANEAGEKAVLEVSGQTHQVTVTHAAKTPAQ